MDKLADDHERIEEQGDEPVEDDGVCADCGITLDVTEKGVCSECFWDESKPKKCEACGMPDPPYLDPSHAFCKWCMLESETDWKEGM
jgi:NMD protein affecting ribosome stability and mRNA decay